MLIELISRELEKRGSNGVLMLHFLLVPVPVSCLNQERHNHQEKILIAQVLLKDKHRILAGSPIRKNELSLIPQ